ncbi:MAG: tetratricopeptide repeat protein [Verrucomicrobiales bacterium]|nr:tetratricopeptide repeat protein [Verrucomicrobiales bacterium]
MALTCLPAVGFDSVSSVLACSNTYHYRPEKSRLDGAIGYDIAEFPVNFVDWTSEYHQYLDRKWQKDEPRLLAKFEKSGDFKDQSDYGVALMHNGKTAEALQLFEALIKDHPDEYPIASNLGTAYELAGNNQRALEWIKTAVGLHKDSHEGTEWLHIRILESKIAMETDPDWLENNSVSGYDFGRKGKPEIPRQLANDEAELQRVFKALRYQLKERVQFVKPTDPIVSRLLFDLSSIVAHLYNLEDAGELNALALKYHATRSGPAYELMQKRFTFYDVQTSDSFVGSITRNRTMFIAIGVLLLALLAIPLKFHLEDARESLKEGEID